ncbi:MAG: OmpA family protein [Limnospira sp. PMC 1291.21]|nr:MULTISPECIES: OmpA family protein [Limnospira]MDC0837407.1 OmpA family protein [Limnoraphis robusta]MDY7053903.1 OmpA family protein [Limnospira fusiformis LS22]QJB27520.1 OmpA family protein [Limnospira fusiformis SAG 85.79]RAQ39705.1 OmpA family protein [Arthrospira sp. O9.13F]EDZ93066.1 OmpA/MotB domain protein [Limnospira maxima CS-328]
MADPKPSKSSPKSNSGVLVGLLSFIFRLLLLGVGSAVAWVVGMAVAQVYPNTSSEMPLTEQLLRREPAYQPSFPDRETPRLTPPKASPTSLTPEVQQTLQPQLQQLQQDLNALIGRTAALEIQIGNSRPAETLERRLQIIEQQLTAPSSPEAENIPPPTPRTARSRSGSGLIMTLPSDILFNPGSSTLRPGANVILDNLIPDLQNYRGAVVRVAGHTDDSARRQQNLVLSSAQAEAVVQYLSNAVDYQAYHWVAIGYGMTRPALENTSDINRQLNRRIEVAITPP